MAITKRSENVYLVRVYVGRDRITKKRIEVNETVHGTFEDAERREQVLKSKSGSGQVVRSGRMTVKQLLKFYSDSTRRRRGLARQRNMEYVFDKYVVPYIGSLQIRKVTPSDIQRFLDYLLDPKAEGNNGEKK